MKILYPALTTIFFITVSLVGQGPASWSSTQIYTHPSLVIDSNGVTYISLKDVTAGTLLSNTEYWALLDDLVPKEDPPVPENLTTPDLSKKPNELPPGSSGDGSSTSTFKPGFRRDGTPMDPSIPTHFDVDGYYDRNNDVRDALANQPNDGVLAYDHYINFGIDEDRMFDNYFVPLEYLNINQDLRVVFTGDDGSVDLVAAVNHWFNDGMSEGRVGRFAMPDWFDAQQYMDNHNDVRDALDDDSPFGKDTEAWWHFYRIGAPQENRSWNDEEFTLDAYIALNQDVSVVFKRDDGSMDKKAAMYHYIYAGNEEGRTDTFEVPTWFNSSEYLSANPDIASSDWGTSEFKSFNHFFRFGAPNDNRSISTFNLNTYIANNQDVVSASNNDRAQILIHYIAYGFTEGRKAVE